MPLAAMLSQNSAALPPNSGTLDNHRGGGGSLTEARDAAPSTIRSKLSAIVVIASQKGTTNTNMSAKVMTVTARLRRFHSRRCTRSMIGQVATTSVVAHMSAGRNGRNI